jgi:hypothetical protein
MKKVSTQDKVPASSIPSATHQNPKLRLTRLDGAESLEGRVIQLVVKSGNMGATDKRTR